MNVAAARGMLPLTYRLDRKRPRLTYMGAYGNFLRRLRRK